VNLIGDHTDYNDGFVLPMAIQLETVVTTTLREDHHLTIRSTAVADAVDVDLNVPLRPRQHWSDYVVGVAYVLAAEGRSVRGADLVVESTLPQGAGLSSSAALEVATAFALLEGDVPDRVTVARWCQRAENEFVGARVGIMDQYVACLGQRDHALLIDCRSLHSRPVSVPADVAVIVSNTMVKHSIAGGEYNARRHQCEDAVRTLQAVLPLTRSLRDVRREDLEKHGHLLSSIALKRARHVVAENERVTAAAEALERHDLPVVGRLMRESHRSLRDDYEVTSAELDLMAEIANELPMVYGSRMTGGGFGGSTVTLAAANAAEAVMQTIRDRYQQRTGTTPDVRICIPADGASEQTT
jgi:galactokinase